MKNLKCRYLSTHLPFSFLLLALALFGFYSANSNAANTYSATTSWCSGTCPTFRGGTVPVVRDARIAHDNSFLASLGSQLRYSDKGLCPGPTPTGTSYNCVIYNDRDKVNFSFSIAITSGCIAPLVEVNGICGEEPPNPCTAKTGKPAIPSGQIAYGENAAGTSPTTARMCDADLCVIKINHGTTIPIGDGLQANYITNGTFTGEQATGPNSCPVTVIAPTPKDPDLPKPIDTVTPAADTPDGVPVMPTDCPAGSAFGSVNGVNVCSPSGSEVAYQPSTTTQTNNGTTTESTTQKSDTVNDDGSVTTKTTTTSSSNGSTSTTTTSDTNGLDGLAGKDGKGIDNIDLGVAPSAESGEVADPFPPPGSGVDGEGGSEKVFGVTAHFVGGGSCLADKSVTTPLGTWTIPLSQLCPWFDIMYKIISLVAVFAALRILVMA